MSKHLSLKELRVLELILSALDPAKLHHPKFIIRDNSTLLSGNFFEYDSENHPYRHHYIPSIDYQNTERFDSIFDDEILPMIRRRFHPNKEDPQDLYKIMFQNSPELLSACLKKEIFHLAKSNPSLSILDKLPPYMFDVDLLNAESPKLKFYILDNDVEYELLSVLFN